MKETSTVPQDLQGRYESECLLDAVIAAEVLKEEVLLAQ